MRLHIDIITKLKNIIHTILTGLFGIKEEIFMSEMTKGENVVSANPIHAKKERDISGFQEKINPILNMITAFLCIVTVLVMLIEPLFVLSNKKRYEKIWRNKYFWLQVL